MIRLKKNLEIQCLVTVTGRLFPHFSNARMILLQNYTVSNINITDNDNNK